mmetsp:Transcript_16755/g.48100  ORF Transcript_16755/g.48100 Transcript_16755/m.48100 type:complete len:259 (-) Transcript_16755:101-877(-)
MASSNLDDVPTLEESNNVIGHGHPSDAKDGQVQYRPIHRRLGHRSGLVVKDHLALLGKVGLIQYLLHLVRQSDQRHFNARQMLLVLPLGLFAFGPARLDRQAESHGILGRRWTGTDTHGEFPGILNELRYGPRRRFDLLRYRLEILPLPTREDVVQTLRRVDCYPHRPLRSLNVRRLVFHPNLCRRWYRNLHALGLAGFDEQLRQRRHHRRRWQPKRQCEESEEGWSGCCWGHVMSLAVLGVQKQGSSAINLLARSIL